MKAKRPSKPSIENFEPTPIHVPIETIDDAASLSLRSENGDFQRKIQDLEEQTKLIPLLQMQIQSLREERKHLQMQLQTRIESRASSTSSSSPHPQPVFQAQRVSPVSLSAIKVAPMPPKRANRSTGTNTNILLHRDVGCSPEMVTSLVHKGVHTDFILKTDGDGGRLYTERDLKKAIEMAHAKMRKATATVGVQVGDKEPEK